MKINSIKREYRAIIASSVTFLTILSFYFGVYLPFRKAQIYINAMAEFSSAGVNSLKEFNDLFDPALDYYSPIGQEEITSSYLGILISIVSRQTNKDAVIALVSQADDLMKPTLEAKKGFSYSQNVYLLATIYKVIYARTGNEDYYQRATFLFNEGLRKSPNRKIFLTGLLELYHLKGDKQKEDEIKSVIEKYWPQDEDAKRILNNK